MLSTDQLLQLGIQLYGARVAAQGPPPNRKDDTEILARSISDVGTLVASVQHDTRPRNHH